MCLILFSYKAHPCYKIIIAANRDEFYQRKTEPAHFWMDSPDILAGKDLEAGGTWMGLNKSGELSMLTNYRDLSNLKSNAPSRGHLVSDYLKNRLGPEHYLTGIEGKGQLYNGFNIICGNPDELWYYGNYQKGVHKIEPGIHGLSNALLNSSWPKVVKGKEKLTDIVQEKEINTEHLFKVLFDDSMADDAVLPDTGVGLEKERMLSPMFIKSHNYGSRCSTILLVDHDNRVVFQERTYDIGSFNYTTKKYELELKSEPSRTVR